MMIAGFIHFDCLCGLDIYFLGDLASGEPPIDAIEIFQARVGNHKHAIFTSFDGSVVPCPCCKSMIQLPSAQVAAFLGKMSQASLNNEQGKKQEDDKAQNYHPKKLSNGYNLHLTELN